MTIVADGALRTLVDANRDQIKAIVTRHRGRSVAIFGSVARGDEGPDSDLDFLVDFETGASLFDLVRIEMDLAELLGRDVDVVSLGGLLPEDDDVRRDAVRL
jgi:predicted nucleotidyltransferase